MTKKAVPILTGLLAGFCSGLFGSGGGTVLVPCLEKFMSVETHKAHATAIAVILPLCMVSGFIYFYGGAVPAKETLIACAGGFAGGLVGAKLLGKIKGRSLRLVFGIFMLIGGVRMLI